MTASLDFMEGNLVGSFTFDLCALYEKYRGMQEIFEDKLSVSEKLYTLRKQNDHEAFATLVKEVADYGELWAIETSAGSHSIIVLEQQDIEMLHGWVKRASDLIVERMVNELLP